MRIDLVDNNKDFLALRKSWNAMYLNSNYSVFQSFDFNYFSWKYISSKNSSAKLSIIIIHENNDLISIFPLNVINKSVRFINDTHVDFCDILLLDGYTINLDSVIRLIKDKFRIKSFQFLNLKKSSNLLDLKRSTSFYQKSYVLTSFSFLNINRGSFPDNCSNLLSKQKYEIRKILKSVDAEHIIMSSNNQDSFPIKKIKILRNSMISSKKRSVSFLNDSFLSLIESMYYGNLLDISLIIIESQAVAISLIVKNNNNFMFWIDLFDSTKRVNIYNYISFIRHITTKSSTSINFGRGIYKYKMINFRPDIANLYALKIYNNRFGLIADNLKYRILCFSKYIIKKFK